MTASRHMSAFVPRDAFRGQRYAWLYDPDCTGVDLFAPMPRVAACGYQGREWPR